MALQCKRGDTIQISGTRVDLAGDPVSLADTTIFSDMVKGDSRVSWSTQIVSAPNGTFTMTIVPATSANLETGAWRCDIEFRHTSGTKISTETFTVTVIEDITQ